MKRVRFVGARLTGALATLLLSSFVIFGSLYVAPGTPLSYLTHGRSMSPEAIAQLKAEYHLDEPFLGQYWHWLSGVLTGNLGTSIIYKVDVSSVLAARMTNTIALVAFAGVIIILAGLGLGVLAGLRPGWVDSSTMLVATAAMAVPSFVASVVLTLIFAVELGWLPVFGPGQGLAGRLEHLILPAIALALASVAFVARLTRAAVRQEMSSEHVQTAVSRGLPRSTVIRRHVVRNAAVPMLTVAGLTVAGLIAGSVVVEGVFQLNGLGSLLVSAVQKKDFPVVQAICLIYVVSFVVLNTVIDMTYSALDPRIAAGRRRA